MKITENLNYIRQQKPGQFKRPEDGTGPFASVNDQKLDNIKEQKECSIYVSSRRLGLVEKSQAGINNRPAGLKHLRAEGD